MTPRWRAAEGRMQKAEGRSDALTVSAFCILHSAFPAAA